MFKVITIATTIMKEEMGTLLNEVRIGDFAGDIGNVQQGVHARRAAWSSCGVKEDILAQSSKGAFLSCPVLYS